MLIDKLAYSSPLAKKSPKAKMLYGMITLAVCLLFSSITVSCVVLVVMSITTVAVAKINLKRYILLLTIPLSFIIIGTITIIVGRYEVDTRMLISVTVQGYAYGITQKSLYSGFLLITRAMGAISCMYFISLSTPMNDLLYVLRQIKIPSLLVTLMELIYRYIFIILDEAGRIKTSQGARLGYNGFRRAIHSTGELLGTLFFRALDRCDRVYSALQSRGYEGEFQALNIKRDKASGFIVAVVILNFALIAVWMIEKNII